MLEDHEKIVGMASPFLPSQPRPPRKQKRCKSREWEIRNRQMSTKLQQEKKERELAEKEAALEAERLELERKRKELEELVHGLTLPALKAAKDNPPEAKRWRDVEIIDNMARRALGLEKKVGGDAPRPLININYLSSAEPASSKRARAKVLDVPSQEDQA